MTSLNKKNDLKDSHTFLLNVFEEVKASILLENPFCDTNETNSKS